MVPRKGRCSITPKKAHKNQKHKFKNYKFWETPLERLRASALPPSNRGARAGLLRDYRQNLGRVFEPDRASALPLSTGVQE